MERRTFLWLSLASTAGLSLTGCTNHSQSDASLKLPLMLSQLCDENTIKAIGADYREKVPSENDVDELRDLLMMDENAKVESMSLSQIAYYLSKKIKNDFEEGKILAVKGWILSVTESRQCALYSLL